MTNYYVLLALVAYLVLTEKHFLTFVGLGLKWLGSIFPGEVFFKLRLGPRLYFETLLLRWRMRRVLSEKHKQQQQRDHGG